MPQKPCRGELAPGNLTTALFQWAYGHMVKFEGDWSGSLGSGGTLGKVVSETELTQIVAEAKRAGRHVAFTNGCFDLLHPGHTRLLEKARDMGDLLIVAVNTDRSVRENKGPSRPVVPERERAEVLAALAAVDYVVLFDEPTPREIISRILPSVLVKGSDWGPDEIVGREEVEGAGGSVISLPLEPGYSTSSIIERASKLSP